MMMMMMYDGGDDDDDDDDDTFMYDDGFLKVCSYAMKCTGK